MSSEIVIQGMTVAQMIEELQKLVAATPSLADALVTYQIPEGGGAPISKIEVFPTFGWIRICDPRKKAVREEPDEEL